MRVVITEAKPWLLILVLQYEGGQRSCLCVRQSRHRGHGRGSPFSGSARLDRRGDSGFSVRVGFVSGADVVKRRSDHLVVDGMTAETAVSLEQRLRVKALRRAGGDGDVFRLEGRDRWVGGVCAAGGDSEVGAHEFDVRVAERRSKCLLHFCHFRCPLGLRHGRWLIADVVGGVANAALLLSDFIAGKGRDPKLRLVGRQGDVFGLARRADSGEDEQGGWDQGACHSAVHRRR